MSDELSGWSSYWESGDYVLYNRRKNEVADPLDLALIYHRREHFVLCIENNEFAYALKKRMFEAGVPIVDTQPPGENILQYATTAFSGFLGTPRFIVAYNEVRGMKIAGQNDLAIRKRIQELISDTFDDARHDPRGNP